MSAPTENTNATKWTLEKTHKLLDEMEYYVTTDAPPLIGKAIRYCGANRNVWSYLKKKWQDDEDITERITNIEEDFENKLVEGGLTKRYLWSSVRFLLMTKYNYRVPTAEKPQTEATQEEAIVPERPLTKREKKIMAIRIRQAERRKNDGKDFAARDTDGPTMAKTRTRARNNPKEFSSTRPNEPYIEFSDDLFAYIG